MKTFGPKSSTQNLQVEIQNTPAVTIDDGYVQGTTADGDAFIDNPVVTGGVYTADPTASTLTDGDAGNILLNALRMQIIEDRTYDSPSDANKNIPVFIPQDRYSFSDLSGSQADADATISYYVSMESSSFFSIQYIESASSDGYQELKIYGSNQDDSDLTLLTYTNLTQDYFGSESFGSGSVGGLIENWLEKDTFTSCKALRIDIEATSLNPGDTSVWNIYLMKKSA